MQNSLVNGIESGVALGLVEWASGKNVKNSSMDAGILALCSMAVDYLNSVNGNMLKSRLAEALVVGAIYTIVKYFTGQHKEVVYDFILSSVCHSSSLTADIWVNVSSSVSNVSNRS